MPDPILVSIDNRQVARVRLNRPEVRNALDAAAIAKLAEIFQALSVDERLRAVVLEGEGAIFCGGADINYMRAGLDLGEEENYADALRLADMFAVIDRCPVPVVAKVQGAALGGGVGLIAVCDVVVAARDAQFGFTEVKLGIVPAVISPFVVRKLGPSHARALFMTGERFDAERALRVGLVHHLADAVELDAVVERIVKEVLTSGPQATRVAKDLAKTSGGLPPDEARASTAQRTAQVRAGEEGQEGLRAFLEKRKPKWQ